MNEIKFDELAGILSARNLYGFPQALEGRALTGVSIDSRNVGDGVLYIPVTGEHHDGHDFILDAVENGASAVLSQYALDQVGLSEKALEEKGVLFLNVDSTLQALRDLAGENRSRSDIPVVALTGSAGKTTTKDLIASVLSQKYNTLKTEGNLNNVFGVPRTLLEISPEHEAAVIEMGMDQMGEIAGSIEQVRPDIAIITNIGTAHLERLGSRENILRAKSEILTTLQSNQFALLNGDDDMLDHVNDSAFEVRRYGMDADQLDLRATDYHSDENGISFTCGSKTYHLGIPGRHNVYNALAAIWVGTKLGLSPQQIQDGFDAFKPSDHRMNLIQNDDVTIIDDSYNANPASMVAALDTLEDSAGGRRKVAILGDMFELGPDEITGHLEVGRAAARKADYVIGIGEAARNIIRGAIDVKASMKGKYFVTTEEAARAVPELIEPGDIVLVKGSRGMHLEQVVDALSTGDDI